MPSSVSSLSSWSDTDDKKGEKSAGHDSDEKEYDSDGNELYVVEEIRDKRTSKDPKTGKRIVLYQLKWKGYSDKEMTWEPEHNLDCPDLLEQFERKLEQKERNRDLKRQHRDRQKDSKRDSSKKSGRKSYDDESELNKPSTSGLSRSDLKDVEKKSDSAKKRLNTSDSDSNDSSDDQKKKRVSKRPKRVKEALMANNDSKSSSKKKSTNSEDIKKKSFKKRSHSDSDSSDEKNESKKDCDNDMKKKIMSRPGPKRAKEARLARLKASESQKSLPTLDSDVDTNDSLSNDKKVNKPLDSDNELDPKDETTKKIMSKPGPKRAKEARLARLNSSKQTPTQRPDSDEDSKAVKPNKDMDSDSDSHKSDKTLKQNPKEDENLDKERNKILSKPGPKRAKEARIAKLNLSSTPKTTQIDMSFDNEECVEKTNPKSSDLEESLSKSDKSENDHKKSSEAERLMSRPGPKAAKEARLARLSSIKSSTNTCGSDDETKRSDDINNDNTYDKTYDKELDIKSAANEESIGDSNKTSLTNKATTNSTAKDSQILYESVGNESVCDLQEEQRKKVLSRPGPKRAKEARLKKIDESFKSISNCEQKKLTNNKNGLDKRTNSTDSLDAIISTPAPEEEQQTLVAEISENGIESDEPIPVPDSEMVEESDCDATQLSKIGNYVCIETTKYVDEISNALSIQNGGLDMAKPGFIRKQLNIKHFPKNSKNPEKIISAFYNENKLCFLIKWFGNNKCDVIDADELNKNCPLMVIDFYQSKLRFS